VTTLLSFFSELFTYGLSLDEQLASSTPAVKADSIFAESRTRLQEAKAAAVAAGKRPADVEEALFAVVAWLDEVIAKHPAHWDAGNPLQVEFFDTRNAGNEFFSHLHSLGAEQDEVREVYYVAMCLGFVGQYYFEAGDTGELGKVKEMQVRHLPSAPAALHTLAQEKITAQPYEVRDPDGLRLPSRLPEKIAKGGVTLAIAGVAGILSYYLLAARTEEPAGPDMQAVTRLLAAYPCHDFDVAIAEDTGLVQVRGHVKSVSDRDKLKQELSSLEGGEKVVVEVETLADPFCEVVGVVAPLRRNNEAGGGALSVATRSGSERLMEDDIISFDATVPKQEHCLYVDYLVADGASVVHLFPSAPGDKACGQSSQTVAIGDPKPGVVPWKVTPPFGREMVIAISSPKPLFADRSDGIESPAAYVSTLRELVNRGDAQIMVDYSLVITEKKQ